MANHKSAEKRILQTEVRTERNRARKAKVKTLVKKVDVAIAAKDKKQAASALSVASRELQRTASKGTLHKNTVARRISRLAKKVNKSVG